MATLDNFITNSRLKFYKFPSIFYKSTIERVGQFECTLTIKIVKTDNDFLCSLNKTFDLYIKPLEKKKKKKTKLNYFLF